MKRFSFFFFGLLIGFFDFFLFLVFLSFFIFFLFLEMGSLWFGGIFFRDSFSFFLLYLTAIIFLFCYFSNFSDLWKRNLFFSYNFIIRSIFFLLLLSFTSLNVFLFYICFELIFMFIFVFVIVWGYRPERVQASFYIVFYTIVVSFPFLVYLVFLWRRYIFFKILFVSFLLFFILMIFFLVGIHSKASGLWSTFVTT